jgi:dihydrodipicolinate reductase
MNLRVCIAGPTGWVGKPLSRAVADAPDLLLVGAVSRSQGGRILKEIVPEAGLDLRISGSVAEALETPTDNLIKSWIDYFLMMEKPQEFNKTLQAFLTRNKLLEE